MLKFSLKFVPKGPINNIPDIIWTNDGLVTDAYIRNSASMSYAALLDYKARVEA